MSRLALLASHPIQYYTPLFRKLAERVDLTVFYAHRATDQDQAREGFQVAFNWDVDLLSGYRSEFLNNVSVDQGLQHFTGVDTPEIYQRLRDNNFDALLLMGWHLKSFIQGLTAAKRISLPVMVRGDSTLQTPRSAFKVAAKRIVYPFFLRLFDGALVVGINNRAYWEHYFYPKHRIFSAPHCVDNQFFAARATSVAREALRESLGISKAAKAVLFAGKLVSLKCPLDLVEATASVRKHGLDAHLLVAGSGPLEAVVRDRAKSLDVPLHLLGFCNQMAMPSVYAAADVLAVTSESETWGLVVNEALASGLPVLVSHLVGCAPDIAACLGDQIVFKHGAVPELAEKLHAILTSPPSPQSMRDTIARFDPELVAEHIRDAVIALCKPRGRA